jgi:hypothetical protein
MSAIGWRAAKSRVSLVARHDDHRSRRLTPKTEKSLESRRKVRKQKHPHRNRRGCFVLKGMFTEKPGLWFLLLLPNASQLDFFFKGVVPIHDIIVRTVIIPACVGGKQSGWSLPAIGTMQV